MGVTQSIQHMSKSRFMQTYHLFYLHLYIHNFIIILLGDCRRRWTKGQQGSARSIGSYWRFTGCFATSLFAGNINIECHLWHYKCFKAFHCNVIGRKNFTNNQWKNALVSSSESYRDVSQSKGLQNQFDSPWYMLLNTKI